jgi:hypothetical protein
MHPFGRLALSFLIYCTFGRSLQLIADPWCISIRESYKLRITQSYTPSVKDARSFLLASVSDVYWFIRDIDLTVEEPEQEVAVSFLFSLARLHSRHSNPSTNAPSSNVLYIWHVYIEKPCVIVEPLANSYALFVAAWCCSLCMRQTRVAATVSVGNLISGQLRVQNYRDRQ